VGELEDQVDLLTPEIKWARTSMAKRLPNSGLDGNRQLGSSSPALPDWNVRLGPHRLGNVRRPPSSSPPRQLRPYARACSAFTMRIIVPVEGRWRRLAIGIFESTAEAPMSPVDVNLDGVRTRPTTMRSCSTLGENGSGWI